MHLNYFLRYLAVVVLSVVVCASSSTTAGEDNTAGQDDTYVLTELDDPLQPVWDRLDEMPRLVSEAVQETFASQFNLLDNKFSALIYALKAKLTIITQQLSAQSASSESQQSSQATSSNETLIRQAITEAVAKIERHIDTHLADFETKIIEYIDIKFGGARGGNTGVESGRNTSLSSILLDNSVTLHNISTHVLKINEKIGAGGSEGEDTCGSLVDKVSELMENTRTTGGGGAGGGTCTGLDEQTVAAIKHVSLGSFLARDCSDTHWQQPEAPSGVYTTFPAMDPKDPVNSYCDMGQKGHKETGGWTVILRRHNSTWGLVNFNRTWEEYRRGFGSPGEGEWWFGLGPLHALTYRQPFEVDLVLHDIEKGTYQASYTSFRVEDESKNFTLNLDGFSGNLSHDALIPKHHGSPFSTWDRDNDFWHGGSCAKRNGGGWWFNACHYTTLTATFPTSSDREASTIRWLEEHDWLVLDDVTMKIRPVNYGLRFDVDQVG